MKVHALKYVAAFVLPMLVAVSFISGGPWSWLPVIFAFVLLPLLEWWIGKDDTHLASVEASM
ncbi:MAG: hypothetical protein JNM00_08685, partial [Flavobacteriales bacterium]|nr:hypothetical protein [Flavobacteriales bacterium]